MISASWPIRTPSERRRERTETVTALQALVQRLNTGHWQGIDPTDFNASAETLGPDLNAFASGGSVVSTPPAFIAYEPPPFLRPYDLGTH